MYIYLYNVYIYIYIFICALVLRHINPLTAEFFIPFRGTELIFYKPSSGTDLFQCLLFGMEFFLWYLCFPG